MLHRGAKNLFGRLRLSYNFLLFCIMPDSQISNSLIPSSALLFALRTALSDISVAYVPC